MFSWELYWGVEALPGPKGINPRGGPKGINPRLEQSLVLGTKATAAANAKSFRELEKSIYSDYGKRWAALTEARTASWSHTRLHVAPPMIAKRRSTQKVLSSASVRLAQGGTR